MASSCCSTMRVMPRATRSPITRRSPSLSLTARAGLHVGAVTLRENAAADIARGAKPIEVEGLAKPLAARVMALARGGQTLLSAAAVKALGDTLPDGHAARKPRPLSAEGRRRAGRDLRARACPVQPFAPPADTDKAYRVVRAGDLWRPLREVRHNLPAERDTFVGRSEELRTLAARLDAGTRLLTVLGSGGTGKTRLVRRYGWMWLGDWPGGVYFCDLSEAKSLDGIFFAVASALEVPLGKDDPAVQLGHAIAGRGRCLVMLDNFEQVLAHAQATLGRWLDRAADAASWSPAASACTCRAKACSRSSRCRWTRTRSSCSRCAPKRSDPTSRSNDTNRSAVAEVVRLLDGCRWPSSWRRRASACSRPVSSSSGCAIASSCSPARAARPSDRQRFRAAIDWSWDLLTPWEQAALAQCSVFEGGFTLEAAEAVLDLSPWPEAPPTLDAVQALVDKSLLRTWVPAEQGRFDIDEPYFGMYLSIHEYAAEKLRRQRRTQRNEHARSAMAATSQRSAPTRRSRRCSPRRRQAAPRARARARQPRHGVPPRSRAQRWRDRGRDLPRGVGSAGAKGPIRVGHRTGRRSARVESDGRCATRSGAYDPSLGCVACRRNGRRENLPRCGARARHRRATAPGRKHPRRSGGGTLGQGHLEQARAQNGAALAIHREVGNRRSEASALCNLSMMDFEQGRLVEALAHSEDALVIAREAGDRRNESIVLGNLGSLYRELGKGDQARSRFDAALAIAREFGDRRCRGRRPRKPRNSGSCGGPHGPSALAL